MRYSALMIASVLVATGANADDDIIRVGEEENLIERLAAADQCDDGAGEGSREFWELQLICEEGSADALQIKSSVPADAAAAVLGLDANAVSSVATVEDLGMKLLPQIGADGSLTAVGSISTQPFWSFDNDISSVEYRNAGYLTRVAARTSVSVAIAEGVGASESMEMSDTSMSNVADPAEKTGVRAAIGFTTELFDEADPRFNTALTTCLLISANALATAVSDVAQQAQDEALAALFEDADLAASLARAGFVASDVGDPDRKEQLLNAVNIEGKVSLSNGDTVDLSASRSAFRLVRDQREKAIRTKKKTTSDLKTERKKCTDEGETFLQSRRSLKLGFALAGLAPDGNVASLEDDGGALWLNYRQPLSGNGSGKSQNSIGVFAEHKWGSQKPVDAPDGTSLTTEADSTRVGVSYSQVRNDLVVQGAASYVSNSYKNQLVEDEEYTNVTVSFSVPFREGVWFEGGIGWSDSETFSDDEFLKFGVKVDFGSFLGS